MAGVCEFHCLKEGKIIKKIYMLSQRREFTVLEQEAVEDLITKKISWKSTYICPFPNKTYARTAFIGRVQMAAYEEAGLNDMEYEIEYKSNQRGLSSILGEN